MVSVSVRGACEGACRCMSRDIPIREPRNAVGQVPARLILWINEHLDVDLGQLLRDAIPQVVREPILLPKRRLTPLQPVSIRSHPNRDPMRGSQERPCCPYGLGGGAYLEAVDEN